MIVDWIKVKISPRFKEAGLQVLTIQAIVDCRKTAKRAAS
jgi:hypothetical protein